MQDIIGHSITINSGLELKIPKFPVVSCPGDHTALNILGQANIVSVITLGVSVTVDETKKCVLYLGGLWTEQSVQSGMNNITRHREKGEVVSPWTMLTQITNWTVYGP